MAAKKSIGNTPNRARANRCRLTMPIRLERAIDVERRRLSKAHAVLGCLAVALESPKTDPAEDPDYGEVVEVARERELLDRAA